MIRRMASGLTLAVLMVVLCVPAMAQWWPPGEYANHAERIYLPILRNSYSGTPLPDIYTEDEPPCADDYSRWYWFSTTEATEISIYVMGATEGDQSGPFTEPRVEVQVGLYQVSEGGLSDVRCESGGADFDVHFVETLAANATYYLQIGATTMPHSYQLVIAPTFTNDEMSSAQQVTLPFFYTAPHASAASSGDGEYTCADRHSIWFTFTLDRPKLVNLLVYATDFRIPDQVAPRVGLYTAGDSLSLAKCTGDGTSEVTFPTGYAVTRRLEAGTYYLQMGVAGRMPNFHSVNIQVEADNDDFVDAKRLTFPLGNIYEYSASGGESVLVNGTTIEKSIEPAANPACSATLRHSIWYKFKLNSQQVVTLMDTMPYGLVNKGFPNTPILAPQYMDLWKKGSSLQAAGCSSTGKLVKTLDAGTYYLRIASPIKLHKQAPSTYTIAAKSEPVGMPTIIDQPEDVYINSGQAATLSVAVSSPTPVSYQWYSGYSGDTSHPIDGATGPVYTTPVFFGSGASSVWVKVTNAAGSRDSTNAWFNYRYITTVDLLENGDFEAGSSGWTLKNGSGDKVSCNDKGYESPCAFVFMGGVGEKAKISQTQPLPPASFEARLVLSLEARTKSTNKPFVVTVTVIYSDGKPPMVKKLTYPALSGSVYTRLSDNVTLYGPSHAVEAVTLTIRHRSTTGKTFIDEVELQLLQFAGPWRGNGVLPPPDAPDGFRGTN